MNFGMIRYVVGKVLEMEGLMLLLPAIVGLIYKEEAAFAFPLVALICFFTGFLISFKKITNKKFYALEGYVIVALSWIGLSFFGCLPFVISGEIPSIFDALFETISGFTTTGASVLTDVEALSMCMLFWRSFTHWIGGMGVLVFVLAVLPLKGDGNMSLMKAESPGPSIVKLVPRLRKTAIILYGIYSVMTLIEIVLLLIFGMPAFDAVTLSFGTAGTGGFGIKNSSLADYAASQQYIITIFMILFGINFSIYYLFLCKKWKQVLKSEELRAYIGIIVASIAIITGYIYKIYGSFETAFRHAAFQVGSIITTTGYSTTDFDLWQEMPKTILLMLMFVGACAGSTGGGIKVSRILILIKTVNKEIFSFAHPHGVKKVKMDGHLVDHSTIRVVNVFLGAYSLIFALSVFLISVDNFGFTTNFSAVAATFNNIGPGFDLVGPTRNFGIYSNFSKCVMMFDMLAGRLEIFPIMIIFSSYSWRKGKIS